MIIAEDAGTSVSQLHQHYIIGTFPRRASSANACAQSEEDSEEESERPSGGKQRVSCSRPTWCGSHTYFE